jgi:hypothetical protein
MGRGVTTLDLPKRQQSITLAWLLFLQLLRLLSAIRHPEVNLN